MARSDLLAATDVCPCSHFFGLVSDDPKQDAENTLIVGWLIRLTNNRRNWGIGPFATTS